MKKILILAYFFPPCNLAGAHRAYGWAKYLKEMGYFPIIVTRNWDIPLENPEDAYISSGNNIKHEINDDYEVYFLPYKSNLRDRIFVKYKYSRWNLFRKILSFLEIIFQSISIRLVPFKNLYYFSKELIKKNKDIKIVITTGNPFILFRFGYLLKKHFKILWIADYRDDWNTNKLKIKKTLPDRIVSFFESGNEKRWVSRSDTFLSVSDEYVEKISNFTNKIGHVIGNGFIDDEYPNPEETFDHFAIVYNGTLYDSQKIEIFIDVFKKIIDKYADKTKIYLYFIGLAYENKQTERIKNLLKGYENFFVITNRIPKEEVIKIQLKSSLLLMVSHGDTKGIPSSKIYQYMRCYKNIFLCPSDSDIMEKILTNSGLGIITTDPEDAFLKLEKLILEYIENKEIAVKINNSYISQFSRKEQTKKLAHILDKFSK